MTTTKKKLALLAKATKNHALLTEAINDNLGAKPDLFMISDSAEPEWLDTPDDSASFGMVMFDGPELIGDSLQNVPLTRLEYDALTGCGKTCGACLLAELD